MITRVVSVTNKNMTKTIDRKENIRKNLKGAETNIKKTYNSKIGYLGSRVISIN